MVIGRTLNTTEYRGLLATDVTNVIRVVRFHGTVLSLTKHKTTAQKAQAKSIFIVSSKRHVFGL